MAVTQSYRLVYPAHCYRTLMQALHLFTSITLEVCITPTNNLLLMGNYVDASMKPTVFSRASPAHHTLSPLISVRCHQTTLLKLLVSASIRNSLVLLQLVVAVMCEHRLLERVLYRARGRPKVLVTSRLHRQALRHHGNKPIGKSSVRDEKSVIL